MSNNQQLFDQSKRLIPGGVNSPVRAFQSVGGTPRFMQRAQGARIWDCENKEYIDYVCSWGPLILGHAHPEVIAAITAALRNGVSFGAPTHLELELAQTLCALLPSLQQVRLVSSGTEATMSAIRLARGFTGRDKIVKFEGCYHGHVDALLVKAGSGGLTFGQPSSAGIPIAITQDTIVLDYNNSEQVEKVFQALGDRIAAVIVEPIAGNMNLLLPDIEFLRTLRERCTQYGTVLIFDEVMTGFRVGLHGAQGLFKMQPDLTTLGKIIGGGLPLAAFGGRKEIMQQLAPMGPVYQAGTLSGNPVAVSAGLATLRLVQVPGFYDKISHTARQLVAGLSNGANKHGIAFCGQEIGGMFGIYFRKDLPHSFADVMTCDRQAFNRFFHFVLERGIYFAPSAFEAGFVSSAHGAREIDETIAVADNAFADLAQQSKA
jgi:glutamate-1-semialdehyde 2,1-aminomutase